MIYLDHAAATPVDPRVLEDMLPYFGEKFANPSSIYQFALHNRQAIDAARKSVSGILEAKPDEIYFTGSGTESNNWAVFGVAEAKKGKRNHLVTSVIEHHSVLHPCEELERRGWKVTYLPVDEKGHVDRKKLDAAVNEQTALVSIAYANNEIGTIENIAEIAAMTRVRGALLHTDACQAAGALPLSVKMLGVDMMTINGGKIYGPKGSAILYIRDGIKITPLLYGGGQEHRQRAGTENVAGIVGFARALEIAESMREKESARLTNLRDSFIQNLQSSIKNCSLNGDFGSRLPNNINISFAGVDAESLLLRLDMAGICASAGSACTSGALEPSHVLMALGVEKDLARSSIRMTLGRENTETQLEEVLKAMQTIVKDLRAKK